MNERELALWIQHEIMKIIQDIEKISDYEHDCIEFLRYPNKEGLRINWDIKRKAKM